MSKKTVTLEIFQCDHMDDSSNQCNIEGERQAIKQCALCQKDLCSRHYEMLTVNRHGGTILSYFFCSEHADEFIETLVKTFGDTKPIPYAGMAK